MPRLTPRHFVLIDQHGPVTAGGQCTEKADNRNRFAVPAESNVMPVNSAKPANELLYSPYGHSRDGGSPRLALDDLSPADAAFRRCSDLIGEDLAVGGAWSVTCADPATAEWLRERVFAIDVLLRTRRAILGDYEGHLWLDPHLPDLADINRALANLTQKQADSLLTGGRLPEDLAAIEPCPTFGARLERLESQRDGSAAFEPETKPPSCAERALEKILATGGEDDCRLPIG